MRGISALKKLLEYDFETVLDIGSGSGEQAQVFRDNGKRVTTIAMSGADINEDYNTFLFRGQFDCIWASHVLEHQPDPNSFLRKVSKDLKDEGLLALTVPPLKHQIVGGHVTLWNAGLLLYQLILAGFDCSKARVYSEGYDISVIVKKKPITLPKLDYDSGDIERLSRFFPFEATQGFDGRLKNINW